MKKLVLLLCTIAFLGTMSAFASCPCQAPVTTPCCETPQPCCNDDKPTCCDTPDDFVVKQESCCWGLSQTELFKKLCLSQCQMNQACCLFTNYKNDTQCLRDKLKCERDKLCQMIKGCASKCEINEQRKKIKEIRKDLKAKFECYEEKLKDILTKEQKKDYKKINKEENAKYKKLMKNKCCCKNS